MWPPITRLGHTQICLLSMKTKITFTILTVCLCAICSKGFSQTNYSATNTMHFEILVGAGAKIPQGISITNFYPGSYPFNRIAGENENDELMNYIFERAGKRKPIPEIMPVEIDTNGNWGEEVNELRLSVRFQHDQFDQGKKVPVYIIVRNLGISTNAWWRNGPPDYGYQFTLSYNTNTIIWRRPQQHHLTEADYEKMGVFGRMGDRHGDDPEGDDPFWCKAEPHTEDLTVLDLNRFFDLHQPGQYSLQIQITVPDLTGGTTNVVSGICTFEIVQSASIVTH